MASESGRSFANESWPISQLGIALGIALGHALPSPSLAQPVKLSVMSSP